jgi:sigma-B regulation protein RsbU (phosphoserine phosphatase)
MVATPTAPGRRWRVPEPAVVPAVAGVQLAAVYRAPRSGGDFYEFLHESHRVLFLLMDIAGERNRALDIAAEAQACVRSQGRALFASPELNESEAIAELALLLNRAILAEAGGVCHSPAFLACYNLDIGTVSYVNAGHTPALLRDSAGLTRLAATGLPLGLFSHSPYEAQVMALQPGAALLLVSRGVIEAGPRKRPFGLEGVEQALRDASLGGAQLLCTTVLQALEKHAPASSGQNDATIAALLRTL